MNWLADTLPKDLSQSHGVMANYIYDLGKIERNHEAYVEHHAVLASSSVRKLARASTSVQTGAQPGSDPALPTGTGSSNESDRLRPVAR